MHIWRAVRSEGSKLEFSPNPEYSPQKAKEQRTAAGLKTPQRVPRNGGLASREGAWMLGQGGP